MLGLALTWRFGSSEYLREVRAELCNQEGPGLQTVHSTASRCRPSMLGSDDKDYNDTMTKMMTALNATL